MTTVSLAAEYLDLRKTLSSHGACDKIAELYDITIQRALKLICRGQSWRICRTCFSEGPVGEFHKHNRGTCRRCRNLQQKKVGHKNRRGMDSAMAANDPLYPKHKRKFYTPDETYRRALVLGMTADEYAESCHDRAVRPRRWRGQP